MRSNWGFLVLGLYLILTGLGDFGIFTALAQFNGIVAVIGGVLILVEQGRK